MGAELSTNYQGYAAIIIGSSFVCEHATTTIETHDSIHVELKRIFTPIEVFGIGFSVIGLIPSMAP